MTVIDNWITVAVDTHTKYGTWATATHLETGKATTTHQIIVLRTITISTQARGTFHTPAKATPSKDGDEMKVNRKTCGGKDGAEVALVVIE